MRRLTAALAFAFLGLVLAATAMAGKGAGGVTGPAFYVNGQLYRTVNTPTDLSKTGAPAHSFDSIYDFGGLQLCALRPPARKPSSTLRRRRSPDPADSEGVRPPVVPRQPSPAGLLPRPADGSDLGLRRCRRHRDGDRSRAEAAPEDRGRSLEPAVSRDRLGRGLPIRGVSELAVIVALATPRGRHRSPSSGFTSSRPSSCSSRASPCSPSFSRWRPFSLPVG